MSKPTARSNYCTAKRMESQSLMLLRFTTAVRLQSWLNESVR